MSCSMIVVFNEIAPSENTFIGFLGYTWKFDRKINRVNYAKLVSFNLGYFVQDTRYYTFK